MPLRTELADQARDFANRLSQLLNSTITDGIRVHAVMREDGEVGWLGYKLSRQGPFVGDVIPLTISRAPARCFLHVLHTLRLDPDLRRLIVQRSSYGLYRETDLRSLVFHYDYDREPENEYPMAHFQIAGECAGLEGLTDRTLERLHFPVGGKRYRPSLEDIIEFLVTEQFVAAKPGWEAAINQHRNDFHRIQLRSAIRRDPGTAADGLRDIGYAVQPPDADDAGPRSGVSPTH